MKNKIPNFFHFQGLGNGPEVKTNTDLNNIPVFIFQVKHYIFELY